MLKCNLLLQLAELQRYYIHFVRVPNSLIIWLLCHYHLQTGECLRKLCVPLPHILQGVTRLFNFSNSKINLCIFSSSSSWLGNSTSEPVIMTCDVLYLPAFSLSIFSSNNLCNNLTFSYVKVSFFDN